MSIICTILKTEVPVEIQDTFLVTLQSRLQEQYPDLEVSVSWGDATSFTNSDSSSSYVEATLPLIGPGLMRDIIIFS